MPKYRPVADRIADGLFAAKNRMFDFVQQRLNEGKDEKEIMKELKETVTADPSMLAEIEHTFFKKKAEIEKDGYATPLTEVYESIDHWIEQQVESQGKDFLINDTILISKLKSYYGFDAEEGDAEEVLNRYYKESGGKAEVTTNFTPAKVSKFNPYKKSSWIDDAKVGDQVELNDETGEVIYIGNDKIEVKTPTKTETIWKN